MKTKKIYTVTLTNQGGHDMHNGHHFCYGIPSSFYPEAAPGAKYRVTIEYLGSDPAHRPEHFAFVPRSEFGARLINDKELPGLISECRRNIRRTGTEPVKGWWKARLKKLLIDQRNYRQSVLDHRAAVGKWKQNLPP